MIINDNFYQLTLLSPIRQFDTLFSSPACAYDILGIIIIGANKYFTIIIINFFYICWLMFGYYTLTHQKNSNYTVEKRYISTVKNRNKSIFFVLFFSVSNIIFAFNSAGLIPYIKTLTSQIIITFMLAYLIVSLIWLTSIIFKKETALNKLFPAGVPIIIIPIIIIIEFFSFFSRLFSLAIRLFANMTAGHSLLKILSSFFTAVWKLPIFIKLQVILLLYFVIFSVSILEVLISFLQAYVFVMLLIIWLDDE